jgi:phosphocarrier protein HPr
MHHRSVVVGSAVGLHARPAALIAERAGSLAGRMTLARPGGTPIDAASALLIMSLGAEQGDRLEVAGEDEHAVAELAALVEADLDARPG